MQPSDDLLPNDSDSSDSSDSADFPTESIRLKLVTWMHARAGGAFAEILQKKAVLRNIDDEFEALVDACSEGSTKGKEPDQSFYPAVLPQGRSAKWPSVVLETGSSESLAKLEDARWWLHESNGDVKAVITISLSKTRRFCIIDLWKLRERKTRSNGDRMAPEIDQHITVTKEPPESETRASNTLTLGA
ncbi:hypothetical protein Plec18167_001758 [Paecilomyces lecythidis]|uniref:Uncharacterized protein n=1 Tax=Paecilomyces lecythidis TaxID=3004212 RepID=A0ABR3YAX1_9EURO